MVLGSGTNISLSTRPSSRARCPHRADQLTELQRRVLKYGFTEEEAADSSCSGGGCSVRGKVWKIFLGLGALDAATYLDLVRRGCSPSYDLIVTDVKRTFKSDPVFRRVVTEAKLIRVLSAIDHWCKDALPSVVRAPTLDSSPYACHLALPP